MFSRPRPTPGRLAQYDEVMGDKLVASLSSGATLLKERDPRTSDYGWPNVRLWVDEELHELIARNPDTASARLAASEVRRREAWQTPAKWALVVSLFSLAVSATAFLRTL